MSDKKISLLPAVSAALLTDTLPVVQGGITRRETLQQVLDLFNPSLDASLIPFVSDTGGLTSTNVEAAINEVFEAQLNLGAEDIAFAGATGGLVSTNVEDALGELDDAKAEQVDLIAHVAALSNPHQVTADQVAFAGTTGGYASITVEDALGEVWDLAANKADIGHAHDADDVTFISDTGIILSTTVGSALREIADEYAHLTSPTTFTNALTVQSAFSAEGAVTIGDNSGDSLTFHPSIWTLNNDINISGANIGVGVSPSNWQSSYRAIQLNARAGLAAQSSDTYLVNNAYVDAGHSRWEYVQSAPASRHAQTIGFLTFDTAVAGTADTAITWKELLRLGPTEVVVNEFSNDIDFRVESDGNTHALFVEGSSGNLGIGVMPESIQSTYTGLRIGGTGNIWALTAQAASADLFIGQNVYRPDGTADHYIVTDEASRYYQTAGTHVFDVAASGTADTDITWTTVMQLDLDSTAGNTRLLIWDVDNGALERVSVGAADSGGAGFKLLRVAN